MYIHIFFPYIYIVFGCQSHQPEAEQPVSMSDLTQGCHQSDHHYFKCKSATTLIGNKHSHFILRSYVTRKRYFPLNTLMLRDLKTFQFQRQVKHRKKSFTNLLLQFRELSTCQLFFQWDSMCGSGIYLSTWTPNYKGHLSYAKWEIQLLLINHIQMYSGKGGGLAGGIVCQEKDRGQVHYVIHYAVSTFNRSFIFWGQMSS